MLPRSFRKLLHHKETMGPLWALLFCTSFFLPLVAAANVAEGQAKMDKYDSLQDETVYEASTFGEYQSTKLEFDEGKAAFFIQAVDVGENDEPILYVFSDFATPSFGFPYLEGSFISLPKNWEPQMGCYYQNFDSSRNDITSLGGTYSFAGKMELSLPHLSPLEAEHPIQNICLMVREMDSIATEDSGIACYDCSDGKRHRLKGLFGEKIKSDYKEENSSFSSYVQFMAAVPSTVAMLLVVFLSSLFLFVDKKNASIVGFYGRNRGKNFLDSLLDWGLIIVAPIVLGLAGYLLVSTIMGLPSNGGLAFWILAISLLLCLLFSLIENRIKGGARCRNNL